MSKKKYNALSFRKTPWAQRGTYTYEFVDGQSITIAPEENANTEKDIKILHRMDDHEVYINIKNSRPPIETWQKKILEEWEKDHSNELPDMNWNVSLDQMLDCDRSDPDSETGYLKAAVFHYTNENDETPVERMHELISMMKPRQQMVYQLAMVEKIPNTKVAKVLKVSEGTIRKDIKSIQKCFLEDTVLKSFFH